ncbi:MAG: glycoside hydrolase family 1 protein [Candidatus Saccharimonadales bacterium]
MPEELEKSIFPKDFLWGASTAGHQVEGGNRNQWTEWEKANAQALAKTAKNRIGYIPAWKDIKRQATEPVNYISGNGVKHYQRYEEDFTLAKQLNLNAFRFSIEWARLEPVEGQWDKEEILHYHRYIRALKSRGIEPVMNIWHWTHPVWFEHKGAFKRRRNLKYFERFVKKVAEEYGGQLKYVITLNEPNVYASFSYLTTDPTSRHSWPPGEKNLLSFLRVYRNLVSAHKRSYKILKSHNRKLMVSVASQLGNVQAHDPHDLLDSLSTKVMRYVWNWWYLNRIRKYQDFVGINYYFTDYYDGLFRKKSPEVPRNDVGWYMEPEGLYPILLRAWAHYKKPIIVTENGVADTADQYRRWWIEETIVAMERAISQGVDVRGYFHWSLLDNFEWAMGWWPKFGLVAVDRQKGMKRTVRESAKWFSERIPKL